MRSIRHELVLPDLGLEGIPIVASLWLVPRGSVVREGDRILEVVAGEVTIDLPAPSRGILVEQVVAEDERLHVGQTLAVILAPPSSP
jgi:pyruvate/2-oxoglutarate dehydrogenase complex dihydrolipoamide acyltransferase (E2) component